MKKDFIIGFAKIFGLLIGVVVAGIIIGSIKNDEVKRTYNDGICATCGGHYEFINASVSGMGAFTRHHYFYKCDSCGKLVEISK